MELLIYIHNNEYLIKWVKGLTRIMYKPSITFLIIHD
jgi:hypothetical protein